MSKSHSSFVYSIIKLILIVCGVIAMIICSYFTALGFIRHSGTFDSISVHEHGSKCTERCDLPSSWRSIPYNRENRLQTLWGSYKPGTYFGLKTATPVYSLSNGILWSTDITNNPNAPRHDVNQDELSKFEWQIHDGRKFGSEELIDPHFGMSINASFALLSDTVSHSMFGNLQPSWIQKFTIQPTNEQRKSFMFYCGIECSDASTAKNCLQLSEISQTNVISYPEHNGLVLSGYSKLSGYFWLFLQVDSEVSSENNVEATSLSYCGLNQYHTDSGLNRIRREYESIRSNVRRQPRGAGSEPIFDSFGDLNNVLEEDSKFIMFHAAFNTHTTIHVTLFEHIPIDNINDFMQLSQEMNAAEICKQSHQVYSDWATNYIEDFNVRFSRLISQPENEVVEGTSNIAKLALSSILGGIGYFYGAPRVGAALKISEDVNQAVNQTIKRNIALLTGSPSRTAFPRGFLWDEGFHELLISEWDPVITMQVISDWLHAMHFPALDSNNEPKADCQSDSACVGGWIPREMILGDDATRRVPDEFVTQRVNIANPPTFLLVIEKLLRRTVRASQQCTSEQTCSVPGADDILKYLNEMYPLLHQWVNWFLVSQEGPKDFSGSFRWRGRSQSDNKIIPNTLSSGLDDYPRSAIPSEEEHHVDLLCWMITATRIMHTIETALNQSPYPLDEKSQSLANTARYGEKYEFLHSKLDSLHWSTEYSGYYDVGLSGVDSQSAFVLEVFFKCSNPVDNSGIEISVPVDVVRSGSTTFCPESHPKPLFPIGDGNGGYKLVERYVLNTPAEDLKLQHIPRVGYVSIFPLLLKHVKPTSPQFVALLDVIEDPNGLWTDFGLRSIAKRDKFYLKRNSPGDAPYWRGPIWININYLAISALHHYSQLNAAENPHLDRVKSLYARLRDNVQRTILGQYKETGYFWEQYEDSTGKGIKGHPFTGWTALIVNIIAESY